MRWTVAALPLLLLVGCGPDDPSAVADRLFKARQIMFEKPELLGINRDGSALLITYTDQAKMDGAWIRYKCYPPAATTKWYCDRIGDPTKSVFLP